MHADFMSLELPNASDNPQRTTGVNHPAEHFTLFPIWFQTTLSPVQKQNLYVQKEIFVTYVTSKFL